MRVGIITATKMEGLPFVNSMNELINHHPIVNTANGFETMEWIMGPIIEGLTVFLVITNEAGKIKAAKAAQHLIDRYSVDKIINYGVVGGLTDDVPAHTIGYVKKIIQYDFDATPFYEKYKYPNQKEIWIEPAEDAMNVKALGIPEFICASGDRFVKGGNEKRELEKATGANVCDMESAAILVACNDCRIPVSFIKAVSDGVDEDEEEYDTNVIEASKKCVNLIRKALSGTGLIR